MALHIK